MGTPKLWVGMVYVLQGRVLVFYRRLALNSTDSETHREMLLNDNITIEMWARWNVLMMIVRAIEGSHAACTDESRRNRQSHSWRFSFYNNDGRLSVVCKCYHYVYVVLYSTRAAQNGILHQKDVDRLNFITTVVRITVYYILQEYGWKGLLV